MENDKQELIEHIDLAHDDLNAKITNLERRTRTQLRNINQGMKERLAADKAECLEKVERASIREHFELERLQQHHSERLKNELRTLIQSQIRDLGRHETRNGNRQSRAESDDGVNRTGIKQEEDEDDDEVDDDESENSEEDDFNLRVTAGAGSLFVDDVRRSARHPRFRGQDHGGCRILSRSKSEEALSERGRHRASDSGGSVPSFTFSGLRQLRNRFSGREQNKENEERDFNVGTTGFNINNVPHNEWHGSSGAEGQGEGKRSSGVVSVHRVHDGNSSIVQDRLERSSFSPSGMVSGECSTTDTKTSFSTQPHSSYPCFSQHRPYSRNVTSSGSEPRRLGPSQQPSESVLLHDSLDRDSGYTTKLHSSFDSQCSTVRPSHSPNDPNVPHTLQFQQLNRHQRLRHFAEELGGDPNEPDFLAMNRQFLDTVSHETDKWYERRMLSMERQATSAVVGVGTDDPAAYYRTDVRRGQNHGVNEGPPSWNQTTDHRTVGDQLALHGTDKRQFQYPSDVRIRPSLSVSRDSRTPATVPENDLEDKHTSSLV